MSARVFTIAPRLPFADTLAAGLLERCDADPMALAATTILLPTRRASRTLREAFLRRSGGAPLLLPRMLTVSDLDEDEALFSGFAADVETAIPPEIPPLRRLLLLTRLVMKFPAGDRPQTPEQAARLAGELARLIDQVQTEGLGFARLHELVPADYAAHWQITLDFLRIVTEYWPAILAEEGCIDPADRRNRLLRAQAAAWRAHPPVHPIIAAGITGSVPAAAELLAAVAELPQGTVVLPGLDRHLDVESWESLEPSHPQHALKTLLQRLDVSRETVADWPVSDDRAGPEDRAHPARERLISEALRPAATTHRWRTLEPLDAWALNHVERIDCPSPREEGLAIALMMRQALETEEFTCALVTPDRDLARRVASELERWGIAVDDSAGRPLAVTPPGAFLRLTAEMVASGFAPVPTLAALKHPLANAGLDPAKFRDGVRRLEIAVMRGVRPGPGLSGLREALATARHADGLDALIDAVEACCAPFIGLMEANAADFGALLEAHMRMAEALATTPDKPGPLWLWAEDAGETAAAFAADLAEGAGVVGSLDPRAYPGLLDALMKGTGVRSEFGSHPRLSILGPMEARLQHADQVIIGGLNEDVWPPRLAADPWMSRPMRSDFGLPLPEQRVGHTAHDFANAFCAPRLALTRSEKVEGTPTVPSRWLLRLETVMAATGLPPFLGRSQWLAWAERLDQPDRFVPAPPPEPRPPVEARPKALSATRIETWMRDPYAIYARYVLGLRALDALDAEPGPADYGTLVHAAMEEFLRRWPRDLPPDPVAALLECGRHAFAEHIARPAVWAFWWPRFERLAAWVAAHETERRKSVRESWVEVRGALDIGGFTLEATADRIDLLHDGTLALIDYKTGTPPSKKEVAAGYAPQLPLEALIAREGKFGDVPAREVSQLLYWHLKGSGEGGAEKPAGDDVPDLVDTALDGLRGLVAAFARPETPYQARPHPDKAPAYSDYLHLARVKEWSAGGGDGE